MVTLESIEKLAETAFLPKEGRDQCVELDSYDCMLASIDSSERIYLASNTIITNIDEADVE